MIVNPPYGPTSYSTMRYTPFIRNFLQRRGGFVEVARLTPSEWHNRARCHFEDAFLQDSRYGYRIHADLVAKLQGN